MNDLDNELVLRALLLGAAGWVPFRSRPTECGELCIGGIRWPVELEHGLPRHLSPNVRMALVAATEDVYAA